jgi:hypothetical protein
MHTEYGVPEVKEQQPRSFARDCINQKRRVVAIAGSKNSRRVTSASFLALPEFSTRALVALAECPRL